MASPEGLEMGVLNPSGASKADLSNHTNSGIPPTNSPPTTSTSFVNVSFAGSQSSSQRPLKAHTQTNGFTIRPLLSDDATAEDENSNGEQHPSDSRSHTTAFTESTDVPRRNLGFIQLTALMINGCLGNGFFFTTPCYVLSLIRSKRITLVLFAVGGIYSAIGMAIFLEYGTAFPYTGGALVYLDRLFHRPRLLATLIFSLWWILLASTEAPCKTIAQTILSLASNRTLPELSVGLINFTAVIIQTVVCIMLYFARRLCFALNTASALYKIILLLFISIAGIIAAPRKHGFRDFNDEFPGYQSKEALTAMVYIILCYQGWDNANYVAGEAKDYKRTLKWAGITTIAFLTCLNMLAVVAFFGVADFAMLTNADGQANSAFQFAQILFGTSRGMQVASGLSTFLSLLFITYTTARVKQAAAWQRIIPFWKFFGRQDAQFDSPGGALFLHWIFTVIPILALGNTASDPRLFFSGIYSYGYQIMYIFLGIGLLKMSWTPTYLTNKFATYFVAVVFIAMNIVTLVMTALPADPGKIPRFWWPVALMGSVAVSVVYWAVLRLCQSNGNSSWNKGFGKRIGFEVYVYEEDDDDGLPDELNFAMYEAHFDGSKRRLHYKISGSIERCYVGYQKAVDFLLSYLAY